MFGKKDVALVSAEMSKLLERIDQLEAKIRENDKRLHSLRANMDLVNSACRQMSLELLVVRERCRQQCFLDITSTPTQEDES